MNVERLYEAIRQLTRTQRLRLVERVVHDVAEGGAVQVEPKSIMGMMADEPDVMDAACKLAMTARAWSRMGPTDGGPIASSAAAASGRLRRGLDGYGLIADLR